MTQKIATWVTNSEKKIDFLYLIRELFYILLVFFLIIEQNKQHCNYLSHTNTSSL